MKNHDILFDHSNKQIGIAKANCTFDDGKNHIEPFPNKDKIPDDGTNDHPKKNYSGTTLKIFKVIILFIVVLLFFCCVKGKDHTAV